MGALLLASGAVAGFSNGIKPAPAQADEPLSPTGVVHQEGAYTISAELANLLDDSYTRIANVQGAFEFNQKAVQRVRYGYSLHVLEAGPGAR